MNKVVFIQSKFPKDAVMFADLVERWKQYGEAVHKHTGDSGIAIFSFNNLDDQQKGKLFSEFITQFRAGERSQSCLGKVLALSHLISDSSKIFTLVCGDNQISIVLAIFLKLKNSAKVRIQIQFHGDIYTFGINRGIRGFLRVCLSRIAIHFSDSIRIVSKFQAEEILSFSPNSIQKFVLAPIPIDFSRIAMAEIEKDIDLLFVGRLQEERGITELVKIVTALTGSTPAIRIAIVGHGPLLPYLNQELEQQLSAGSVSLMGFVDGINLQQIYSRTKILISTAPQEGYGLVVREAALSQILVIARESKGVAEAKVIFPSSIETFRTTTEAVNLIHRGLTGEIGKIQINQLDEQQRSDKENLTRLINSWVID